MIKSVKSLAFSLLLSVAICASAKDIYVDCQAMNASDANTGSQSQPLKTISKAAQIAMPGDTVIVKDGIYREWVQPLNSGTKEKPIVYRAQNRHKAVIKGSKIYDGKWVKQSQDKFYSTVYDEAFFEGYNPFNINRQSKFPDFVDWVTQYSIAQIFVDGQLYTQVLEQDTLNSVPQSWFKKKDEDKIYVHFSRHADPQACEIEISVRPRVFASVNRGLGYLEVRGFVIEHCANQYPRHFWEEIDSAQAGALGTSSGHHWVIDDNIIRFANTIGIDCGSETSRELNGQPTPPINAVGYHTISNNIIELNGCTGISGWGHTGTNVVDNVIRNNNTLGIMAWETGGIKFHGFYDGLIKDNLIENNGTWAIWLDNIYKGSRIEGNLLLNNLWGGIFFEMGSGPCYVINNVIANTVSGNEAHHRGGHGIYGHDAAGVKVYHNLIYCNSGFGVTARVVAERPGGSYNPCQASDWDIQNNLIIGNKLGNIAFTVPFERSKNNLSDNNVFLNGGVHENTGFFSLNTAITETIKINSAFVADYLKKEIISKKLTGHNRPNVDDWSRIPYLTFKQWQAVLGCDLNSKLLVKNNFSTIKQELYQFQALPDTGIYSVKFNSIAGVDCDYFGNTLGSKQVYAGPFQGDFEKNIMVYMWPKLK